MAFADLIKYNNSSILEAFLNDANRFLLQNRDILNLAPLQLYSSAIVFAPATSIIRNKFKEHIPSWLHRLPKVQKAWNAMLQTLEGHSGSVESIAFSPDGKLLASGSFDKTIKLWDIATGDVQQNLEGHLNMIESIAFSPDGKLLASDSYDETVKLWDTTTDDVQQTLEGHSKPIQSIAFSPDGMLLASDSTDKTIKLWNIVTGDVQTLEGHSGSIESIVFSPDGKLLASGSLNKTIKLWDTATGNLQQIMNVDGIIEKLWFHMDKPYPVTNIGLIRIQQSQTDVLPQSHQSSQVFLKDNWIIWNGENIIWLPSEYRETYSDYRDNVLALGCASGLVTFFEIDFPGS